MFKQAAPEIKAIKSLEAVPTDGCLLFTLWKAAEQFTRKRFTLQEIVRGYNWVIPDYMEDHRNPGKDRCYILDHEEVMRVGFALLGFPRAEIRYIYRDDDPLGTGEMVIGSRMQIEEPNYWASKVWTGDFYHFYNSDRIGDVRWNPGVSTGHLVSLRGYKIKL